ncbi:hypothetical protein CIRG_03613 [Coccidioides immitis RMSCC 2394]|uniref:Uncharacterized protein n=1 Tax=Coccidioides immitis RMSCC 2394 TaxID=404692 RepID=A0A0J6Y5H7_COCIT|nr:hypothetical protein CIRG_03613 [Coccidioides immitis RMSCC 2394]
MKVMTRPNDLDSTSLSMWASELTPKVLSALASNFTIPFLLTLSDMGFSATCDNVEQVLFVAERSAKPAGVGCWSGAVDLPSFDRSFLPFSGILFSGYQALFLTNGGDDKVV